ncbi:MAG: hypothetical protein ACK41T_00810 [Pseudobdellovibrio sp.]
MIFNKPYRLIHDSNPDMKTLDLYNDVEISDYNRKGYGVFALANEGNGFKDVDIHKVNSWFVDIDFKISPKLNIEIVFDSLPLIPSCIIDTKNGFHIYFMAKDGNLSNFKIIQRNLVKLIHGSDPQVINLSRIMRVPDFCHMKNANEPYLVSKIFESDVSYYEKQLLDLIDFEDDEEELISEKTKTLISSKPNKENIFDFIRHYDSKIILERLSGTSAVGYKNYKFLKRGMHYNIIVDGKDSGCFINHNGNVIGNDGYRGGAVEWLTWYTNDRVESMRIICEVMKWD